MVKNNKESLQNFNVVKPVWRGTSWSSMSLYSHISHAKFEWATEGPSWALKGYGDFASQSTYVLLEDV
jgi:hypothetical protein